MSGSSSYHRHLLIFTLASVEQGVQKGSHDVAARLSSLASTLLVLAELLQVTSGGPAQSLHLFTLLICEKEPQRDPEKFTAMMSKIQECTLSLLSLP
ncbi:hypothetical protein DNTS_003856 [Danionella cerebrum]|uniref:Uncharacterized protein n=1 Tax=Danionella cerebrum TaxID=2873325 RepID=A0A553QYW4_9TELE|nr:hypothetical protein DNTS_003856 [Danionella translucida]